MSDSSSQPTQPLTGDEESLIREWHNKTREPKLGRVLAEVDRLRAENTAQAATLDRTSWTLRDLLRLAHRRGLFLSRARTSDLRTTYQVWEPNQEPDPAQPWNQGRRWVEVHYWPTRARLRGSDQLGPTWRLRINGSERPTETTNRMAHAELWDPTIAEIVGALGWLGLLDNPPALGLDQDVEGQANG